MYTTDECREYPKNIPYILDNGAWVAYTNGRKWDANGFVKLLEWATTNVTPPEWVVAPDVVSDAAGTYRRSEEWIDRIPFPTYQPVQDGMDIDQAIDFASETGSIGIFVGGSSRWKRRTARHWVDAARDAGLGCHIARPWSLTDAYSMGVDSVDTTSIVGWTNWDKLHRLEVFITEQTALTDL